MVKEGMKRKTTRKTPSSMTSSQGRRFAVKKKTMKAKMEEKGTPYKEKKTSSDSIPSPGSSDNTSSMGKQRVQRKKTVILKKGGKCSNERNEYFIYSG
eukprot:5086707-Ditylum_brightwellii.AAC.1